MSGIRISVIIPTHNRSNLLCKAIESLQNQEFHPDNYEIIVVDNASTDNTREVVKKFNLNRKKITHYLYEGNLGLHNARHAGARIANGEILAYTDDDAIYDANWLYCINKYYNDQKVGCVGGRVLPEWETKPPPWIDEIPRYFLSLLDYGNQMKELDYPGIHGLNFSIRKELLFKSGGFNPESFGDTWLGDGETGLLRKMLKAGYKVIYTPDAVCWHWIPKEHLTLQYFKQRAANQGACLSYSAYKEKRFPKIELVMRSLGLGSYSFKHKLFAKLKKVIKNNEFYYHEWRSSYYWRRAIYELKISYDNGLKELILKQNWLE